ncbi:protealysin inhibitor emfourin [Dactylosporangium sp. NPDC051541]|uniref:protealysin inhibitor emfourin n=1 Tax=Dactylosporangium sp. NPDC051541 TaxID=3363977 RepID=UPI0037A5B682
MERNIRRTGTAIGAATIAAAALIAPAAPAAAGAASDARRAAPATQIVLERSGGFAGEHTAFVVDETTVGGRPALRLAGTRRFQRLHAAYQPKHTCCDRFAYRVTVTFPGDRHQTVATMQGAKAPQILWDVIAQSERYGVRPFAPR